MSGLQDHTGVLQESNALGKEGKAAACVRRRSKEKGEKEREGERGSGGRAAKGKVKGEGKGGDGEEACRGE